jgi:hypothetical protein
LNVSELDLSVALPVRGSSMHFDAQGESGETSRAEMQTEKRRSSEADSDMRERAIIVVCWVRRTRWS